MRMSRLPDDLVTAWLNREDNVLKCSGEPTWKKLAVALMEIGQTGTAEDIRKEKCYRGSSLALDCSRDMTSKKLYFNHCVTELPRESVGVIDQHAAEQLITKLEEMRDSTDVDSRHTATIENAVKKVESLWKGINEMTKQIADKDKEIYLLQVHACQLLCSQRRFDRVKGHKLIMLHGQYPPWQ